MPGDASPFPESRESHLVDRKSCAFPGRAASCRAGGMAVSRSGKPECLTATSRCLLMVWKSGKLAVAVRIFAHGSEVIKNLFQWTSGGECMTVGDAFTFALPAGRGIVPPTFILPVFGSTPRPPGGIGGAGR